MRPRYIAIILLPAALALGFLFGLLRPGLHDSPPAAPALAAATALSTPRPLPEFELTAATGGRLQRESLAGHWTLLFTGFTNCGHVCPMTLQTLSLAVDGLPAAPQVWFVSVDPERDDLASIRDYVQSFNQAFVGATGEPGELTKLAKGLGAPFLVSREDDRYLVDHSAAVFLIDPGARLRAVFSPPLESRAIRADLQTLLGQGAATAPPG